ncbi:hypothetical protein BH18ACT6_BH18ACT6_22460 [soil metagenome]
MTLFRPGQRALIAIACCMVFAACATPPFAETVSTIDESPSTSVLEEDPVFPDATSGTTTPWSPFLCDLVTVIGDQQGSVVGTLQELKTGLSGLPWDQPDREYAEGIVKVEEVVGYRPISDSGTTMPPLVVGDELSVVIYPDNEGTPVEALADLAKSQTRGLLVLVALNFPPDLSVEGRWSLKRFAGVSDGDIIFPGACQAELGQQFTLLGDAVNRATDLSLVSALSAEMLAKYNQPQVIGPLEEAFREVTA